MSMDLSGKGGSFHFTTTGWELLLKMALQYGWKPAGTQYNPYEWLLCNEIDDRNLSAEDAAYIEQRKAEWGGGYCWNDHQIVTATDAAGIADALDKALPDIPDHDALEKKKIQHVAHNGIVFEGILSGTPVNPFEWFSGESKQSVVDFIQYCRAGEFWIG